MAEATKPTSWWDDVNSGIKIGGDIFGTYKETRAKVKARTAPVGPPAKEYPTPSQPGIFAFGEGKFGGFSGLQLGLVSAVVVGLFFVIKVLKK